MEDSDLDRADRAGRRNSRSTVQIVSMVDSMAEGLAVFNGLQDKQAAREWLSDFRKWQIESNWTIAKAASIFKSKMKGKAASWYRSEKRNGNLDLSSQRSIERVFRSRWCKENSTQALKLYMDATRGKRETLREFKERLEYIAERAKVDIWGGSAEEKKHWKRFIAGASRNKDQFDRFSQVERRNWKRMEQIMDDEEELRDMKEMQQWKKNKDKERDKGSKKDCSSCEEKNKIRR